MKILCGTVCLAALTACVAPPSSEMERQARQAAGAEYAAKNCASSVGGFSAARELRQEANQRIVAARSLGATDAVLDKARVDVNTMVSTAAAFTTQRDACNQLVSELAWAMG